MKRKTSLSTPDRLVASLDVIRYELDRMAIAIMDATDVGKDDRARVRRSVAHLARRTDALLALLSAPRLDR